MVLLHSRESDRQREANKGRDTFLSFNRTTEDITKGFKGFFMYLDVSHTCMLKQKNTYFAEYSP